MHMRIQMNKDTLPAILSQRGAFRKLVMNREKYTDGNVLVIRHVGQIAPHSVPGAPLLIGKYREPIAGTTLDMFQTSNLRVGECWIYKGERFYVMMNDIITSTEYSPAITEFVAIRD
jgi:hypothetical protein